CGGLMSVTGTPDGEPTKVGVAIVDIVAGLMLGNAIVAALFAREKTGAGQKIETSLLEACVASLVNAGSNYLIGGKVSGRWGNAHPNIVPYQSFRTADGYLVVGVASEPIWHRFCRAIGKSDLIEDPRFRRNADRVEHRTELVRILSATFSERDSETWMRVLNEAEVPCAPVQTIDRVFHDPQVIERQMVVEIDHPTAKTVRLAGIPIKMSTTPPAVRLPPPLLGQHTDEILRSWLALEACEIEELRRQSVI
ncbi:MAG TPA: CoA transferase, partial [Candidatus Eisenbacteria bacterium]|nr:CoA transferase [Candidatus Eisenbacteria bacterium]